MAISPPSSTKPRPAPLPATTSLGEIANVLGRIEQRLERLEDRMGKLDFVADNAQVAVSVAGDTFDQFASAHDLHERVEAAVKVVERLSRPETLAQVDKLIETSEMLPTLVTTAADAFDTLALEAESRGVDLGAMLPQLVDLLTAGARALQTAGAAADAPAGFFAMIRTLRDPEIRRTLGITMHVAKCLGRSLNDECPQPAIQSTH